MIDSGDDINPKWAFVSGTCCGEWLIEYRNNRYLIGSSKAKELAENAWNNAPRAGDDEKT